MDAYSFYGERSHDRYVNLRGKDFPPGVTRLNVTISNVRKPKEDWDGRIRLIIDIDPIKVRRRCNSVLLTQAMLEGITDRLKRDTTKWIGATVTLKKTRFVINGKVYAGMEVIGAEPAEDEDVGLDYEDEEELDEEEEEEEDNTYVDWRTRATSAKPKPRVKPAVPGIGRKPKPPIKKGKR